jgi:hypothetical protein
MATNISKYVQINDYCLVEVEFNKDDAKISLTSLNPIIVTTDLGTKEYFNGDTGLGITNNVLPLTSIPTNAQRSNWYLDSSSYDLTYYSVFDTSILIPTTSYQHDTIRIHLVSGYNFDNIGGFLLQIRAQDNNLNFADLANFTYAKQPQTFGSNVIKFATNTLFLGNRFYDKYIEFKIPSVQVLGANTPDTSMGQLLNIKYLSDIYITYSTIDQIINNQFTLSETLNLQLPVTSVADNFNCFIAESTSGDYIEFYATWLNSIIGSYIGDIESGRIALYTSNNPNDNYDEFSTSYGTGARKWVLIHEISVYENIPGGTSLLTQKYSFTQEDSFSYPNYFRPVIKNADIAASYIVQYVCRLMNRMDGTQIIRKASYASTDPKKYGLRFTRLNMDNVIPYKVFNRLDAEKANIVLNAGSEKIKYVKVFYDTINVMLNALNEVLPQGTGPLFLRSNDSIYKFKFEKLDTNGDRVNVDFSGVYNYTLVFVLDDNTKIEVGPTYSTNMNTTIGEIEFKLTFDQINNLLKQTNNSYSIIVKNPDGTSYAFYEGLFYSYSNYNQIVADYKSTFNFTDLQTQIADLTSQVQILTNENAALRLT